MDDNTRAELRAAMAQYVENWLRNPNDDGISDHLADFEIDNDTCGYPSEESVATARELLVEFAEELFGDEGEARG